jgi:4-amino-4-deoxy-L-arabinose transferase-like glycosyltransferase
MSQPTSASLLSAAGAWRVPWRSRAGDPPWARPALLVLLAATSALYVWGLGASDWANAFYSAAVQAGAHSWKAFFFGSSDAANFITVDKTPLALWPMDLAARLFGVNSWSILVPQALMGVATVGALHATVRRSLLSLGPRAAAGGALLAGAVLATTPVAALMFRYNNPDALLVLLLTLGAYALLRAREQAGTRWLILAATCVGLGFLAKMLQAFLVVPAFALVYLVLAPAGMRRKLWQLTLAAAAMVASAGWWVAIVAVVPASSRPYIGGSQHNSVLELALGYNGLGRLNGNETGGLGNTNQDAGWLRMFGPELGGQIGWLLPAALILLVAGLWATTRGAERREASTRPSGLERIRQSGPTLTALGRFRSALEHRAPLEPATAGLIERAGQSARKHSEATAPGRTAEERPEPSWAGPLSSEQVTESGAALGAEPSPREAAPARPRPAETGGLLAAFALWGGWLLVTDVVFSLMRGIFHGYYTVALAPPIAALIGIGAAVLWVQRHSTVSTVALAGGIALTGWWSFRLLGRTPSFEPWLRVPVLAGGLLAAAAVLAGRWLPRRIPLTGAAVAVAVALAGPTAYAVDTATTPHGGAIPSAGPAAMGGPGGFPGGRGGFRGGPGGRGGPATSRRGAPGAFPPGAGGLPQPPNGGMGGPGAPGQNPGTGGGTSTGGGTGAPGGAGMAGGNRTGGAMGGRPMGGGGMGGAAGLLDAATPSAAVTALLKQNAGSYTWAAATVGSNSAAGYQLASGKPVMAIGGFNGTDPAPTLTRFQQYVRDGRVHYFLPGRTIPSRGGTSGSGNAQQITSWVTQTFTATTVDGTTVYDLS